MNPFSLPVAAAEAGDRVAVILGERQLTFAELADLAAAQSLSSRPAITVAEMTPPALARAYAHLDGGIPLVPILPSQPRALRAGIVAQLAAHAIAPDIAAVLFTSGTTGAPKGVLLSRTALVASARASAAHLGWHDGDRWLCPLSWAHVGGLSVLTRCLLARATAVLTADATGAGIRREIDDGATLVSIVPPLLAAVLDAPWRPPEHLRAVLVGGGPTAPELIARARDRGLPVLTTYGMSETCSQVATAEPGHLAPPGAVGRALPGIDVRIAGDGEIIVAGEVIFSGYLGDESARPTLVRTGDAGHIDEDGWLHVEGRRDERINTGGTRVDPRQVEDVLRQMRGVTDVLVMGLHDPTWGQVVGAVVVMAEPGLGDVVEALRDHARLHLAGSQRPRRVAILPAIPRTALGKPALARAREDARDRWQVVHYAEPLAPAG